MTRPTLEVADILRDHGPAWREANSGHMSLDQLKVMTAIERCRTAALVGLQPTGLTRGDKSRAARTRPAAIPRSRTTPALWADPVMGSWRRLDRALVSVAANPGPHYEGRLRSAISLSDGWNAPGRRCGGTIDSMASSFSVGSPRV